MTSVCNFVFMTFRKTLVLIFSALLVSSVSVFAVASDNKCTVYYYDLKELKIEESNSRFQATSFDEDQLKLIKMTEAAFIKKGYRFINNIDEASLEISKINVSTDGVCAWPIVILTDLLNNQSVSFSDSKCGIATAFFKSGYVNSIKKVFAQVPSCKKLK